MCVNRRCSCLIRAVVPTDQCSAGRSTPETDLGDGLLGQTPPVFSASKRGKQFFFKGAEKPLKASFFRGSAFSFIFLMVVTQASRKGLRYEFRCRSQRWKGACVCVCAGENVRAHMCVLRAWCWHRHSHSIVHSHLQSGCLRDASSPSSL